MAKNAEVSKQEENEEEEIGEKQEKDGAWWYLIIDLSIVNIFLLYWISVGVADMFTLAWLTWQIVKSMQNISKLPSFLVKMQLKQIKREVPWNGMQNGMPLGSPKP